jgi:hypothetical protein
MQIDQAFSMTYLQLITRHLERNGASAELITVVEDYLEHGHPHDEPSWSAEFDEICQRAVAFANSKAERLRKHKRAAKSPALNGRHRQSSAQERHSPTAFLHTARCLSGSKS